MNALKTIKILDTNITSETEGNILEFIITGLKEGRRKFKIFTPNPEIVTYANHHPEFKVVLNSADVALPDGMGL